MPIKVAGRESAGIFVISLDFELYWGVRDARTLPEYRAKLLGARLAVPAMLRLFSEYEIHATWATVGFLFCESRDELLQHLPRRLPCYANPRLSPYGYLEGIGYDEEEDPYHYAPSLIRMIQSFRNQEIASHTFSHYYCLEPGQDEAAFRADLEAAVRVARKFGVTLDSLVFPRNQYNAESVAALAEMGIKAYRGNQEHWLYRPRRQEEETLFVRAPRLLDCYLPLTGKNRHPKRPLREASPVNVPFSRFLRPYSPRLKSLEGLKLGRILSELAHAAANGLLYHLWWHPHNFGVNLENNLANLRQILRSYAEFRDTLGMESLSMREVADRAPALVEA